MTWVLIIIGALLALPVLIGFIMPVRYEGRAVVEYDRSVQQVWDTLQDVEAHPMTGKMMKSVETLPSEEGRPVWTEDMGRGEIITVTTTAYEPTRRMVRRRLGHAPTSARGAEASALAREGHQGLGVALEAVKAREAVGQNSTAQVGAQLAHDVGR